MPSPPVATKLHLPKPRPDLVARPKLAARLDRGALARLTLISAPTGFGKTSLVAQWLSSRTAHDRTVAWIALDPADDQPAAFWAQVLAALQVAAGPAFGEGILPLLESGEPPTEGVLAAVGNELSELPTELDLVLDDYHVIEDPGIHDGMTFLLDHLPPQVHVLITTRADPPFPLARLRARGELVEIRAADLRFSAEEASTYLNEVMGLGLDAEEVAALEGRTEGWIAALQLAALSMEGRDDIADFVARFTGNDRYIVDYLVEEVLQRLPEEIRTFLLDTCILDRLSGPLCDAVTGRSDSRAMLGALERRNLFLVSLDDQRRWYRYHHLFADVLQAHLEDDRPEGAADLHRRASEWYEREGDWTEAIRHALAARNFDRTAELVEGALPALRKARQETTLRGWIEGLPDDLVRRRPVLNAGYAGALLASGELAGVEGRLDDAERRVTSLTGADAGSSAHAAESAFVDEGELRRVPGQIEMFRAALAQVRGDVPATVEHAQLALELAIEDDHVVRAGAAGFLGIALWTGGDLGAAHRAWSECVAGLERAGHVADALGATLALGDICMVQGRLSDALRSCEHALALVPEQNRALVRGTADMHAEMSEVFRERNDLEGARRHLLESQDLGEHAAMPQHPYRSRVAMAHLLLAEGGAEQALTLLEDAQRLYVSDFFPEVRPLAALRARVWIALGRLREARGWAHEAGLSPEDKLSYLGEFEHITLARLLLAAAKADGRAEESRAEAIGLLGRLRAAAETGNRKGSVIEILILEAVAAADGGDRASALVAVEQALTAAEPEAYVRLFVDEGDAMNALLREASRRGIATAYISELLAGWERPAHRPARTQGLVEQLSDRELDVLRLLASELTGPDITRELMVSLNTVRTHTKNIYRKLGVNNRRAAVRRAQDLGLLSGPR
jgi:LuxR family maltose regulon positive regulatory protein